MHGEVFNDEIKLKEDECCIVFDFGCYCPYVDTEHFVFDFEFDGQAFNDKVINHRYPNKAYQTITKKYCRRLSKVGYPYIFKLDEQGVKMLHIKIGLQSDKLKQYITLNIPIETHMTKDRPACALTLRYFFDENRFIFESGEHLPKSGWQIHRWTDYSGKELKKKGYDIEYNMEYLTVMDCPCKTGESDFTYSDVIILCASKVSDLVII